MIVKVRNIQFDSADEIIVVKLSAEEKKAIAAMPESDDLFLSYPTDTGAEDIEEAKAGL